MELQLHEYQKHAVEHIIRNRYSALFLDMGLGKTVSTLTAINRLMYDSLEINRVLVVAPLRVADTVWAEEAAKWQHLNHLRVSKVLGSVEQRKAALNEKADIFVINRDNVSWLAGYLQSLPPSKQFDMLVIDELSSFKSPKALRFKALRMIRPRIKRVVGLTGTPAPNSLIDLWAQIYIIDLGERFGKFVTTYRQNYFIPGRRNGHVIFDYKLQADGERRIYEKISDICISMKAGDYLELPARIDRTVSIVLPPKKLEAYKKFQKEMVTAFDDGKDEISAANAAALSGKLLQFANGAIYDNSEDVGEARAFREVHRCKIDALREIIETANGQPVLVFYAFKHDSHRIASNLKDLDVVQLKTRDDIEKWNRGEISVLLAHPASSGHGLNLQAGGNIIVWFGLNWSLELYQQANARLHRQGQHKSVIVHHLVVADTLDVDVMKSLSEKAEGQSRLMEAVERIRNYELGIRN